jgi:hypothetical protein
MCWAEVYLYVSNTVIKLLFGHQVDLRGRCRLKLGGRWERARESARERAQPGANGPCSRGSYPQRLPAARPHSHPSPFPPACAAAQISVSERQHAAPTQAAARLPDLHDVLGVHQAEDRVELEVKLRQPAGSAGAARGPQHPAGRHVYRRSTAPPHTCSCCPPAVLSSSTPPIPDQTQQRVHAGAKIHGGAQCASPGRRRTLTMALL